MDATIDTDRVVARLRANARDLDSELDWLARLIEKRNQQYFGETASGAGLDVSPPDLMASDSPYAEFVREFELQLEERIVVILALAPHVRPQLLDILWSRNETTQRGFTEFGGVHGPNHGGFIPTAETALFILAGNNLEARFQLTRLFDETHFFARSGIISLSATAPFESPFSGALVVGSEYRKQLTTGLKDRPSFNPDFPAAHIQVKLGWDALVLPSSTLDQLTEIKNWVLHRDQLLHEWEMGAKLRPGFTCLFHGPPGTGKTLSACLLGQHCGCEVYKIDLSMIVSKYIGETEKNLAKLFDRAEEKGWILFFDEADALFGRRTKVDSSNDRYANQESSFLLQRIEHFAGVVILASNLKTNIDEAFLRRFDSVINFPMPRADERRRIWKNVFSAKSVLESSININVIAEKYEVSGGTIMNVVRYTSLKALSRGDNIIRLEELEEGIRREYMKEGKLL